MTIKLWGVRGSLPRPELPIAQYARTTALIKEYAKSGLDPEAFLQVVGPRMVGGYGGNTTCVEVRGPEGELIIDCGSGLRELGMELMRGPLGKGQGEAHILFTHFHWDHLIGLPFFVPIFIPGNKINFYAVQTELEDVVRTLFSRPFFPVGFEELPSKIQFHVLQPRQTFELRGLSVAPYELDHPDPCWGFRIEREGKSYAHCVDTECTRQTRDELGADIDLYTNADLMLFDAQYTLTEVVDKANWGHSVASFGLDMAFHERIKKVLFVHHDPYATRDKIAAGEAQAGEYYKSRFAELQAAGADPQPVEWSFAVEGTEVAL